VEDGFLVIHRQSHTHRVAATVAHTPGVEADTSPGQLSWRGLVNASVAPLLDQTTIAVITVALNLKLIFHLATCG
jgi:hypothetical protein